ncbi:MAG: sodium-translocating pyrophosphatase [Leptospiraceae bacterium]|nr:sodium-translocating pyrophosphatase [Leptospiraceae bacterium]MDW7976267.1 sodium-translocating pyrophosphatase [Leptospiraceae bacterium]
MNYALLAVIAGILALLYSFWRTVWISKRDPGSEKMQKIGSYIAEGAMAFLKAEYKVLSIFVVSVAIILAISGTASEDSHPLVALSFVVGAFSSGLAGFLGMKVATRANYRTTNAAKKSLTEALSVAFAGGSVMGMSVVGLGIIGLSGLFIFYEFFFGLEGDKVSKVLNVLSGFSLGASSIALFARVGGGIYTKAADVGADLVGKVEAGIPEDHPLNPATIADNVGDNVGDVAGMGADLFESYVGSILGSMVLGAAFIPYLQDKDGMGGFSALLLPLVLAAIGIGASILGSLVVRVEEGGNPQKALNNGQVVAGILMIVFSYFAITNFLPAEWEAPTLISDEVFRYTANGVFFATIFGLIAGIAIGFITEFYTGSGRPPVYQIARQSTTGPATNVIAGLGVGMQSTAFPIILIAAAIVASYYFAGLYGIAISALGMLVNTGIQLAVDAYGPISDNAGGIAEMSEQPPEVRQRTDKLDAVGNTTAAIGKGFAIASAALTALALFAAFMKQADVKVINISDPNVIAGLFVGGMIPFLFSSLAISAVGRAAMDMINEVRRQFNEIPELKAALEVLKKHHGESHNLKGKDKEIFEAAEGKAEYARCVEISTKAAIREMILPGLLAVVIPVLIGFLFGPNALGGLLAGVTVSGVLLAIFQANAGGAWDNAKKMFESGVEVHGKIYKKGTDAHKAAVVGDTVGDPLKDTSGPSLNILIKLMSVVSLIIAPLIK